MYIIDKPFTILAKAFHSLVYGFSMSSTEFMK